MRSALTWMMLGGSLAVCAAACSATKSDQAATCTSSFDTIVAASDYSSSKIGGCDLDGGESLPFKGPDLGTDPALAFSGGRAFFIARSSPAGGVIFELDPHCATPVAEYKADDPNSSAETNPQDLAVTSTGELWIPRFNVPTLLVLDAKGNRVATVDLSSQDPDKNPNMSAIRIESIGGAEKAFVALERLDVHLQSIFPSSIVQIDVATRAVEATATLQGRDPFGAIVEASGAFFLAAPGSFYAVDEKDAGIERFDPVTFTSKYLLGESDLGGSATEVAVSGSCGVAIIADPTTANATSLVTFDADHGTALTTAQHPLLATAGFDLAALAWRGDVLMVGDRRPVGNNYAIHLFDKSGACDLTERPDTLFISMPPVALRSTSP